jgi:hypothetical protein
MKKLLIVFIFVIMLFMARGEAWANEQASKSSATFNEVKVQKQVDNRAKELQAYLEERNSPLSPYAANFVEQADNYQLDWKLVAAISGLESGFGKQIPANSYNGWGWGIYGDHVLRFNSWPEAIQTISKGLREGYLKDNPESDPYVIGPTYAASPTWAVRVSYFMDQIEAFSLRDPKSSLSLAL